MSHGVLDGSAARLRPVSRTPPSDRRRLRPEWADAHPWLISAAVIVSLGARNVDWVTLEDVLVVLGMVWLAVTIGFLGLLLLRRSARHAALVVSWMSLLGLFYCSLFVRLQTLPAGGNAALCHGVLLANGFGLAAILWRLAGELKRLSTFVSLTAAITLAVVSMNLGLALSRAPRSQRPDLAKTVPLWTEAASTDVRLPDIYYVILDGYGRADVLQKYYGFDNCEFLDGLRQRGFYVADQSSTNYPATILSLPSSLNMRYLESGDRQGGRKSLAEMVRTHEVGLRLRERGYKLIHFNTCFLSTACSDIAHVSLGEQSPLPAGSRMLLQFVIERSALQFVNGGALAVYAAQHRRALAELPEVPALAGRKFTFLHLVAPHPPFVFDRAGRANWNIDQSDRNSYVDQVVSINREVIRAIDAVLAKSTVPPIIIVQSDHGPGFCPAKPDSTDPEADYVQERVPILNAYLVPAAIRQRLYPTITPVNTFRLLLTECLGFDYPLLDDRNFLFDMESHSTFVDVTAKVRNGTPEWGLTMPTRAFRTNQVLQRLP